MLHHRIKEAQVVSAHPLRFACSLCGDLLMPGNTVISCTIICSDEIDGRCVLENVLLYHLDMRMAWPVHFELLWYYTCTVNEQTLTTHIFFNVQWPRLFFFYFCSHFWSRLSLASEIIDFPSLGSWNGKSCCPISGPRTWERTSYLLRTVSPFLPSGNVGLELLLRLWSRHYWNSQKEFVLSGSFENIYNTYVQVCCRQRLSFPLFCLRMGERLLSLQKCVATGSWQKAFRWVFITFLMTWSSATIDDIMVAVLHSQHCITHRSSSISLTSFPRLLTLCQWHVWPLCLMSNAPEGVKCDVEWSFLWSLKFHFLM